MCELANLKFTNTTTSSLENVSMVLISSVANEMYILSLWSRWADSIIENNVARYKYHHVRGDCGCKFEAAHCLLRHRISTHRLDMFKLE